MSSVTYQTRVPDNLIPLCEALSKLMPVIERNLYRDLQAGGNLTDLKREYQRIYGINARQFNAIHSVLKGKIKSLKQCHKRHIKQVQAGITEIQKTIKAWTRKLKKTPLACPLRKKDWTPRQLLRWKLHQKHRRLGMLQAKLERLLSVQPKLIFGGRKLWNAQFNLEANGYQFHEQWLEDWQSYRNSQFSFIGSKDETAGCQICQLSQDGTLKIRIPPALESQFGKYVYESGIHFSYGQADISFALENNKAITYRFASKNGRWYIFATVDRPEIPYQTHRQNGMLGVDLNPDLAGWVYCDAEGNLKAKGQFLVNLQDKNRNQTEAIIGDVCVQLVILAQTYGCPIVVESLDFDRKKAGLREQGKRYARMLSNFAYSTFDNFLTSRCNRFGVELLHVNPAYSSIIGLVKFMAMYGLNSATAAALVLARRQARLSERIPAKSALGLAVHRHKHVWSFWNALKKKLGDVSRHSFFSSVANSESEVNLAGEFVGKPTGRPARKRRRTFDPEWDSSARIADSTARSASSQSGYVQLFLDF